MAARHAVRPRDGAAWPHSQKSRTTRNPCMNKSELIDAIAERADVPKAQAGRVIDALTDVVGDELADGSQVSLVGFGTFVVRERPARSGRNPRTGEAIQIAASRTPSFKAGKALKDRVN
nr:HU family DNA-binding protein [Thioalkalivibrio paradoxus]